MARQDTLGTVATNVRTENGKTCVRYHATDVVTFDAETITLNSGGWSTQTTKNRMNQASRQFGLCYNVYQKDFSWFVYWQGNILPFSDGMILERI